MKVRLRRGNKGPDVVRLQKALNGAGASPSLTVDGAFGTDTEAAVREFQARNAPPKDGIVGHHTWAALEKAGVLGADEGDTSSEIVKGQVAEATSGSGLTASRRSGSRMGSSTPTVPPTTDGSASRSVRDRIIAAARLGAAHEPEIHYSQGPRRMEFVRLGLRPPQFPTSTDCSGFVTWCYWSAGADDPNGLDYSGRGNTSTLIRHGRETESPQPGDLVFYADAKGTLNHVALYIGDGHVISHGSEKGPRQLRATYRTVLQYRTYF